MTARPRPTPTPLPARPARATAAAATRPTSLGRALRPGRRRCPPTLDQAVSGPTSTSTCPGLSGADPRPSPTRLCNTRRPHCGLRCLTPAADATESSHDQQMTCPRATTAPPASSVAYQNRLHEEHTGGRESGDRRARHGPSDITSIIGASFQAGGGACSGAVLGPARWLVTCLEVAASPATGPISARSLRLAPSSRPPVTSAVAHQLHDEGVQHRLLPVRAPRTRYRRRWHPLSVHLRQARFQARRAAEWWATPDRSSTLTGAASLSRLGCRATGGQRRGATMRSSSTALGAAAAAHQIRVM